MEMQKAMCATLSISIMVKLAHSYQLLTLKQKNSPRSCRWKKCLVRWILSQKGLIAALPPELKETMTTNLYREFSMGFVLIIPWCSSKSSESTKTTRGYLPSIVWRNLNWMSSPYCSNPGQLWLLVLSKAKETFVRQPLWNRVRPRCCLLFQRIVKVSQLKI